MLKYFFNLYAVQNTFPFYAFEAYINSCAAGYVNGVTNGKGPERLQVIIVAQSIGNLLAVDKDLRR